MRLNEYANNVFPSLPHRPTFLYCLSIGLAAFWTSILTVLALHYGNIFHLNQLHDMYLQLITAAIIFSFGLSVFLYLKSFVPGALLALGGNSGA